MSRRAVAPQLRRTSHPDGLLARLSESDITRGPKIATPAFELIARTVSQSSDATYEIEFSPPCKAACMPLRENLDAGLVFRGRSEKEENVHTGTRCATSSRSGSRSANVDDGMAATRHTASAPRSHLSKEALSIRSRSNNGNRSARTSTSVRGVRSKTLISNDSQGGLSHRRAASIRSRSISRSSGSIPACSIRPPAEITLNTTTSFDTPITTTSVYTLSKSATSFDASHFDAALCGTMVDAFLNRFIRWFSFDLGTEQRYLLLLEDDLNKAYHKNQMLPTKQISATMYSTYNAHAEVLDYNFATSKSRKL